MLQLNNNTPFAATMTLFPDAHGVETLYITVKASFKIGQQWLLSECQTPPIEEDIFWGEPNDTSIQYASDIHIGKPFTDIVMIGNAYSENSRPVKQLDVNLSVGQVNQTIRVFGDRVWKDGKITSPELFDNMPLTYERAYGGMHAAEDQPLIIEERNPVGCGFAGNRTIDEMNGMALPNLENPEQLIQQFIDQPDPACFAFSSPAWKPRVNFAGTYDDAWHTERAPFLPLDFDSRFFNMAHTGLVYPGFLQGGEAVKITNMHSTGNMSFSLPRVNLVSKININNSHVTADFNLETLLLEPNQMQLSMVWRAAFACNKKTLKIKNIDIALSR